jgi:putative transposase
VEQAVINLSASVGERDACEKIGIHRGNFQRRRNAHGLQTIIATIGAVSIENILADISERTTRQVRRFLERQAAKVVRVSSRALTEKQNQELLDAVHQDRFVDRSVPYIYATLLDENRYYGSISTMYRALHRVGEVGERRNQATRPAHLKPELCATAPNRVYAWDITKLHGPRKWTYFYLYAVIDIYSRYVVGWMVADRESSELAKLLLATTIEQQHADPKTLTIHSDRGSSMMSKPVAFMLADLGVTKSHSRPHVSNDNPHIESLFKTAKYQPQFPKTFENLVEARAFCASFFDWYNNEHRHSGIALLTPSDVHRGHAQQRIAARQFALDAAYAAHPERFVHGRPKALQLPPASYINRPPMPEQLEPAA